MAGAGRTSLVVVADDFGRSPSVNRAVLAAREKGILTSASLMPAGAAFEEAVGTGRERGISLGLHVTLCDGASVLPPSEIPDLVTADGLFEKSPSRAWIRYSRKELLPQLEREIEAQFDRLEQKNIRPHHVDGHHHLHLHPAIFPLVCRLAAKRGVKWIRVCREPLFAILGSTGRGLMPVAEWIVFRILGPSHSFHVRRSGLRSADVVYGLSRTGHVDENYLLGVLRQVRKSGGVVEVFVHPDSDSAAGRRELGALLSERVRSMLNTAGIGLAGYADLASTNADVETTAPSR